MSDIGPVSAAQTPAPSLVPAPASPAAPAGASPSLIASDFETFLKMLTTQLKNQDPFNPMNASEFAVQLATFSGVEQQVRTNTLLEGLGEALAGGDLGKYGAWVGMEARTAAPVAFAGAPLTVHPGPRAGADAVQLVVRDSQGAEVARQPIAADGAAIIWPGTGPGGQALPAGLYSFETESFAQGLMLGTDPATSWARITEVRRGESGVMARLSGGSEVATETITALRARVPDAAPPGPPEPQ